jgi:hypothetical protein
MSINSFDAGAELGRNLRGAAGPEPLSGIVVYSTVNHDQQALLRGIREVGGPTVRILGCSSQGVMGKGTVIEEGYIAGAMGLGGADLKVTTANVEEIQDDSAAKGRALGQRLLATAPGALRAVIVHYDPLCGADAERFLLGLQDEVRCPLVGGAAAEFWGPMRQTFQYANDRVIQHGAVAAALTGTFTVETDLCHGTSPVGIEMTVTKSDGNIVLEFDGRPALAVWQEYCSEAPEDLEHSGAIGIGLPTRDPDVYIVRCAFGADTERSGVLFQAAIPEGSTVMLNHRTVSGALNGTSAMGKRLSERLRGKNLRAVLGFECGARTKPFLGKEATVKENRDLQEQVGSQAAWLGMLAWGEVAVFDGRAGFANFSFPVLALAD